MSQKNKFMATILAVAVIFCMPLVPAGHVLAAATCAANPANSYQVCLAPLPHTTATPAKVTTFLTIIFSIIGALSLLMVTIGGFRYVVSQGDPQAVAKAKNTIIYALVGILVSIAAVAIVTFVIGKA